MMITVIRSQKQQPEHIEGGIHLSRVAKAQPCFASQHLISVPAGNVFESSGPFVVIIIESLSKRSICEHMCRVLDVSDVVVRRLN